MSDDSLARESMPSSSDIPYCAVSSVKLLASKPPASVIEVHERSPFETQLLVPELAFKSISQVCYTLYQLLVSLELRA